jgi:Tetratricopeptide repeat
MASKGSRAQGKLDEALKSYRDSLVIAKRLAASDRSNTGWQRDLSVLYNSIGDVLVAQGKLDEALKSYRDSLAIAERLAASDRSNTGWQRDIAVLYEGIGALEEHKRFVLGRETRQRDADRIRRFEEVQRRKRKWIKCGEIPVWISELGGSGPNEAARENAYTIVKEGLLARHFEENGRSQVLFLFPGVNLTRRMTPQRLQDAIDNNYDNQHGRSWVENCWVPRNLLKRWCAWHHLPESPPRFQPEHTATVAVSQPTAPEKLPKAISKRRRPAQERIRQELEKKAPEYIDGPGGETCWSIAQSLVETRGEARKFEIDKTSKALKRYYVNQPKG